MLALGIGLTITSALPLESPPCALHLESLKAVTVQVVVLAGLTLRVAGLEAILFCTTPSDQLTVHGPVPVRSAWIVVELPLQIVVLSAARTTAVGRALTVTIALLLKSPACAVHKESLKAVTV